MKSSIFICAFFLTNILNVNAQLLARVTLVHYGNYIEGANTMYYLVDKDRALNYLVKADTFNTDSLLTCWGTPISESASGDCFELLRGRRDLPFISSFFKMNNGHSKLIKYTFKNKKKQKIRISFLKVTSFDFCKTKLDRRLFASVPADFDEALMLISAPKIDKFDEGDFIFMKTVKGYLKKIK